jgi:MFS family permease
MSDIRPEEQPRGAADTVALLRDRNFFPYLVGNMFSTTGTWFQTLGQALLVYRLTGSAFLLGVVGFAQFASVFLLAPWTGSVADRFDRRVTLVVCSLAASLITGTLTVVDALGHATTAVVIVFAVLLGTTSAFLNPTMMAFVPTLVPQRHIQRAIALNSVTFNVGRSVGPVLAALVIDSVGTAWAFGINSFSYLFLIAGVLLVRPITPHVRPAQVPRLRESIKLVLAERQLAGLLYVIAAVNLATDPPSTLGPAFMTHALHHRDSLAGLLIGAFGLGAVVAAFTIVHRLRGSRRGIMITLALAGIGTLAFSVMPALEPALIALFVMGFGYLATNTATTTRLQLSVDPGQRGRIMALWSIAFLGIRPIGSLIDGAIASAAGVRVAAACMALPALVGAAAIMVSRVRRGESLRIWETA